MHCHELDISYVTLHFFCCKLFIPKVFLVLSLIECDVYIYLLYYEAHLKLVILSLYWVKDKFVLWKHPVPPWSNSACRQQVAASTLCTTTKNLAGSPLALMPCMLRGRGLLAPWPRTVPASTLQNGTSQRGMLSWQHRLCPCLPRRQMLTICRGIRRRDDVRDFLSEMSVENWARSA